MNKKLVLRKMLLAKRRSLSEPICKMAKIQACQHVIIHPLFLSSRNIACYFPAPDEFDCKPIIDTIWKMQKRCFLPVLLSQKQLNFAAYNRDTPMVCNRYNILEPVTDHRCPPELLDLVLVPLVGFDLQGNRLGMGGGFYDRTFQFMHKKAEKKPFLLGISFEIQKVEKVPTDKWDVKLHGVLTEKKLYLF